MARLSRRSTDWAWLVCLLIATFGAPRASAQNQAPDAKDRNLKAFTADHRMMWCLAWIGANGYVTRALRVPADVSPNKPFEEFITRTYGKPAPPVCYRGPEDPARFEASRQDELRGFSNPRTKITEVEWTPPSAPAPAPKADPGTAVPSAPKPNAQSAYEQALAAQRPKSVPQEQLAAAAKKPAPQPSRASASPAPYPNRASTIPAPTPKPTVPAVTSSFCFATGNSPPRTQGQRHYYITEVFPAADGKPTPDDAFGAYIRGQHGQEKIIGVSCTTPGPATPINEAHRKFIENHRVIPNMSVVELTWKPTS